MSIQRSDNWRHDASVYRCSQDRNTPTAVYLHIPFCLHQCGYCDFSVVANRDDLIDAYLEALSNELAQVPDAVDVKSIFVGGGTPTHLGVPQLTRFLNMVGKRFRLDPHGEYSFEANPDGLSQQKIELLQSYGVNRLSLGVQSFDEDVLRQLERTHSPSDARGTILRAAELFPNLSIDLIFGVQGQSLNSWHETLAEAADLPVKHVSTYGLTYEKGTSFYQRLHRNELIPVTSELERDQYATAMEILGHAELEQYEISNFARSGYRCIHNQVYWDAQEYLAFGPGAARYVSGIRSTNGRNVSRWIEHWIEGRPLLQDWEKLSVTERAREAVMLGLRRNQGIELNQFRQRFGMTATELNPTATTNHIRDGLLQIVANDDNKDYLQLTDEGRFLADTVITDFL